MSLQTLLFSLLVTLSNLSMVQCVENPFQKSKLPKEMPADTEFRFSENGGMSRSYKTIFIAGDILSFEQLSNRAQTPTKWSVKISSQDKEKLYKLFVANDFDLIKNDERKNIVYDAGSEAVTLTVGDQTFNKTYGANSPMSGSSLKRYQIVATAINELAGTYANSGERVPDSYVILNYQPDSFTWVFKNVTASSLNKDEIAAVESFVKNAVDERNLQQKNEQLKINISEYKFQYVPVVNEKAEKEVWVNSFCNDYERDWRNQLIMVKDGGKCYFNLKINLTTKKYSDFMVNGNA